MSRPIRVLISGAAGVVAQGLVKSLERCEMETELFLTCIYPDSPFLHRGHRSYLAPLSSSDEYLPFLETLIAREGIDLFIPAVDSELTKISHHKSSLEERTGVKVFCGTPAQQEICADKLLTAQFLKKSGFPYPQTVDASASEARQKATQIGFPLIVKPRQGRGSAEVQLVRSPEELAPYLGDSRFCFQEWLPDDSEEYTSGVYLGEDGQVKGICILKRELRHGSTVKAQRIINRDFEVQLTRIASRLGLKYLNIQARLKGSVLYPFEFNGRFSGTTGIISRVFNAPEMLLREWFHGESIEPIDSDEEFIAMRYDEEIFTTPADIEALMQRSEDLAASRNF